MTETPRTVWSLALLGSAALLVMSGAGCGGCREEQPQATSARPERAAPAHQEAAKKESAPEPAAAEAGKPAAEKVEWIDDFEEVEDDLGLWVEAEPDYGPAPLTVKFTVESLAKKEIPGPKYYWDFGDGTRSNEPNPVHVYQKPGEYEVRLVIKDAYGVTGWDEIDVDVESPEEEG